MDGDLFVADDRLVEECRIKKDQWRRSWALKDLSPHFGFVSGRPEHTNARLMGGLAAVGVSLTVYSRPSTLTRPSWRHCSHSSGSVLSVQATRHWRLEAWTLIHTRDGEKVTHILHGACRPGEPQEFELDLADHIRKAGHGRGDA